jgi:hypothetical protein
VHQSGDDSVPPWCSVRPALRVEQFILSNPPDPLNTGRVSATLSSTSRPLKVMVAKRPRSPAPGSRPQVVRSAGQHGGG